jgi:hypothetical protein
MWYVIYLGRLRTPGLCPTFFRETALVVLITVDVYAIIDVPAIAVSLDNRPIIAVVSAVPCLVS